MQIKLIFTFIWFMMQVSVLQAQGVKDTSVNTNFVGISVRLLDNMRPGVYYRYLPQSGSGFQVALSGSLDLKTELDSKSNVRDITAIHLQRSAIGAKVGWIPFHKREKPFIYAMAINACVTYTNNRLNYIYKDQIYGSVTESNQSHYIYRGIEVELSMNRFFDDFYLGCSFQGGYADTRINIFNHILPGIDDEFKTAPGMGYTVNGVFINLAFVMGVAF